MNIKKKDDGFRKNTKKHALIFYYIIISHPLLSIDDVSVRRIICRCSSCLRKLDSTFNRIQDKYNKFRYEGANEKCVYWPILGLYNN